MRESIAKVLGLDPRPGIRGRVYEHALVAHMLGETMEVDRLIEHFL